MQLAVQCHVVTARAGEPLTLPSVAVAEPLHTLVTHVHTDQDLPPFVQRLTGISPEDVRAAPPFHEVAQGLATTVDRLCAAHGVAHCCWVAHNGHGFDQLFLARYLHELAERGGAHASVAAALRSASGRRFWCADTLAMAKACPFRSPPSNRKLPTLFAHLFPDEEAPTYHQADMDVVAMVRVMGAMLTLAPTEDLLLSHVACDAYFTDAVQPRRLAGQVRFDDLRGIHGATIAWTAQQERILSAPFDQHTCILAGAGCAKTTTLLGRILVLLRNGVPPHRIMLTTFSRDATDDMLARLALWVGAEVQLVAGTIDGLSRRFLRDNDPEGFAGCEDVGEYKHAFLRFLRRSGRPERRQVLEGIDHVLVDEYQDVNETYHGILAAFAAHGARVTAVGDDAQSIYGWNGADIQYILEFGADFADVDGDAHPTPARTYYLTQNFRSTPEIIHLANQSVARNVHQLPKTILPTNPSLHARPDVYYHHTWAQEATTLMGIVGDAVRAEQSVAILARSCTDNGPLFFYEGECARAGLPHAVLERHRDRRNRVDYGRVTLATIHKSKGLEWDVVVVVGCTDRHFPSVGDPNDAARAQAQAQARLEEERRLFYVAVTRAKRRLVFAYTGGHTGAEGGHRVSMTRFLSELPRSLCTWHKGVEQGHYQLWDDGDFATRPAPAGPRALDASESPPPPALLVPRSLPKTLDAQSVDEWRRVREWVAHALPTSGCVSRHTVHDAVQLPSWVAQSHMYADVERWCLHLLVRMRGVYPHPLMERVLKRVAVTRKEYAAYVAWEHAHTKAGAGQEVDVTAMAPEDLRRFASLERKLAKRAAELGVPVSALDVSTRTNVPADVRQRLQRAYAGFLDTGREWRELLWTVFEVSWVEPMERGRLRHLHQHLDEGEAWMASLLPLAEAMHGALAVEERWSECVDAAGPDAAHGSPSPSPSPSLALYHRVVRDGFADELPLVVDGHTVLRVCLCERPQQTANEMAREVVRALALGPAVRAVCTYYPQHGVVERVAVPVEMGEAIWAAWRDGTAPPTPAVDASAGSAASGVLVLGA